MALASAGGLGAVTDVAGVLVGSAERVGDGWLSGCTVVLPPPGSTGSLDVRGGGPATHESDALAPTSLVQTVDAVLLTGGSAYGLAAVAGVQRWCEDAGRGFAVGGGMVVPIVPALALFDLGRGGSPRARPGPELGRAAAEAATRSVRRGCVGAGTGALVARGALRGGLGTASRRVRTAAGEVVVGALAVVNAAGSPLDPFTGELLAARLLAPDARPPAPAPARWAVWQAAAAPAAGPFNTTLVVVATDAALDVRGTQRVAVAGHDGLARSLSPVHTLSDGDAVLVLATGAVPVPDLVDIVAVQAAAADAVALAVLDAVLSASSSALAPSYRDALL